jgi:hypothetical protein
MPGFGIYCKVSNDITEISEDGFNNNAVIILESSDPPILSLSNYDRHFKKIYVPNDAVDTYRTNTYWS